MLLTGPDIGLSRQRHQSSNYRYITRLKETMLKELKKSMMTMFLQVKNIGRDIEIIKRSQM